MTHFETNTAKFVELIARGSSVTEAAKKSKLSRSKAYRLLDDEEVRREIDGFRRQMLGTASGLLAETVQSAAESLRNLVSNEDPRIRLAAIRLVFDNYLKISERVSLEERLEILEEALNDS